MFMPIDYTQLIMIFSPHPQKPGEIVTISRKVVTTTKTQSNSQHDLKFKDVSPKRLKQKLQQLDGESINLKVMSENIVSPHLKKMLIESMKCDTKIMFYVMNTIFAKNVIGPSFSNIKNYSQIQTQTNQKFNSIERFVSSLQQYNQNNLKGAITRIQMVADLNKIKFIQSFIKVSEAVDKTKVDKVSNFIERREQLTKKIITSKTEELNKIIANSFPLRANILCQVLRKVYNKQLNMSLKKVFNQSRNRKKQFIIANNILRILFNVKLANAFKKLEANHLVKKNVVIKAQKVTTRVQSKEEQMLLNQRIKELTYQIDERKKVQQQTNKKNDDELRSSNIYIQNLNKEIEILEKKNQEKSTYLDEMGIKNPREKIYMKKFKDKQTLSKIKNIYKTYEGYSSDRIQKSQILRDFKLDFSELQERPETLIAVNKLLKDELSYYQDSNYSKSTKQIKDSRLPNEKLEIESNNLKYTIAMYVKQNFGYSCIENLKVSYNKLLEEYDKLKGLVSTNNISELKKYFSME